MSKKNSSKKYFYVHIVQVLVLGDAQQYAVLLFIRELWQTRGGQIFTLITQMHKRGLQCNRYMGYKLRTVNYLTKKHFHGTNMIHNVLH